jgi:dTDP-4-dehydrorhamnose 3,5-epimerase
VFKKHQGARMTPSPKISGLKLVELKIFPDNRGFFTERYHQERFTNLGIAGTFVQDNHSRSKPGVIRGLHYQHSPAQGKLVSVIRGKIWDVAVDLRKGSPTFGQWESFELSDENGLVLWIPGGFAHGFCALGNEDADVMYKVDTPYSPQNEGGISYADPDLAIRWPIQSPIVSPKDQVLPSFKDYCRTPVF